MTRSLFSSRRLERLVNFYPDTCQIQEATETVSTMGSVSASWTAVEGLEDVGCKIAPRFFDQPGGARENRREEITTQTRQFHIALNGHFPGIRAEMRAVSGSRTFDILGVEHDSHGTMTRLNCEIVEV